MPPFHGSCRPIVTPSPTVDLRSIVMTEATTSAVDILVIAYSSLSEAEKETARHAASSPMVTASSAQFQKPVISAVHMSHQ